VLHEFYEMKKVIVIWAVVLLIASIGLFFLYKNQTITGGVVEETEVAEEEIVENINEQTLEENKDITSEEDMKKAIIEMTNAVWNAQIIKIAEIEVKEEYRSDDSSAATVAGDTNGDGFVGGEDFMDITQHWGQNVNTSKDGDLSGDGFVGGEDYMMMIENWGGGEK